MRTRGKVDLNQTLIVRSLRECGALVLSLANLGNGAPDLLVFFHNDLFLLEVKRDEKAKLTPMERQFHALWPCHVVTDVESALNAIGAVHSPKSLKEGHSR